MDNTTFFSVSSGNDSGSANDTVSSFLTACDNSGLLRDLRDLEEMEGVNGGGEEPEVNHQGEEEEEGEEGEGFKTAEDSQLNSTVYNMNELNGNDVEDKEFDEMYRRNVEFIEACSKSVMERTEAVKKRTEAVDNDTKDIIQERDQALQDLRGVEQAFSDVHRKYERAKLVLENLKINEEHLKERDEEFQLLISARDEKREAFKQEMEQSMEKMYNDFQAKLAGVEADNAKLAAVHRRVEMRSQTLAAELEHKQRENSQLNSLADDLIKNGNPV